MSVNTTRLFQEYLLHVIVQVVNQRELNSLIIKYNTCILYYYSFCTKFVKERSARIRLLVANSVISNCPVVLSAGSARPLSLDLARRPVLCSRSLDRKCSERLPMPIPIDAQWPLNALLCSPIRTCASCSLFAALPSARFILYALLSCLFAYCLSARCSPLEFS